MAKTKKPEIPNVGPRTEPALRAVILMNRLKHRPKSVIIQTDNEIVVQVRGEFDHLVKKLKKTFKNKGKDESGGVLRVHAWKLRGLGLMNVYHSEKNDYMSVRFLHKPELGIRRPKEEDILGPSEAERATMAASANVPQSSKDEVPDDLDLVLLKD
jgi:hypothetical protein